MQTSKITTLEAIMLILTIVVTHTVLSLPRSILVTTKSASILNLIYVSIIAVFISIIIFKLLNNFPGSDLIDISQFLGGKILKNIIGFIFIVYFLLTSGMLLRNFCESIKILYYPMTNVVFIILLFIVALCIANKLELASTIKTNTLILPIVLFSMLFLFFSNIDKFVPQRIFPILGEGIYQTFGVGLINLSAFGGITYLYFLPPILKDPKKTKKVFITSIVISAIYLILCVSTLLFMFPFFLEANEITPLYTATRYIEFGNFIQRLESTFLLIWILAFAGCLSIVTKFAVFLLGKIINLERPSELTYIFGLLIFAISIFPKSYATSENFETLIYPYMVLGISFGLGLTILILANLKKKFTRRKT